ncbi:HD domain-containing phosphohydrolase [Stratiformator vulcanicus]|uniref:Cyclic di-GMP phosphodiesterase response regulator RpfG n=1 Tax=Stratiformator vulcanicus TaxID=2527980 RepID=A0A517R624_9PLAN|nr:HD domain-containing phosphohydrolase [Stratiformator vulcanicus]QDT39347.1 Cyclic di-GMP phosphodiesterase response regulator RpfG [Stratiformator vulcanicus]
MNSSRENELEAAIRTVELAEAPATRILIADDDALQLEMLEHFLHHRGYEVYTASNGAEAYQMAREHDIRLIVTDWMMPELTGVELCRKLRENEMSGYVYVILLTSRNRSDEIIEGMSAGADDFIAKPFNPEELRVRLEAGQRVLANETRDMAIFMLAKLAESRDPETGQHLERVQRYASVLARTLAKGRRYGDLIDPGFIRTVYLTSPLHDVGKVGIPDAVLLKPGRLTPEEFEIMKQHTLIGARTIEAIIQEYPGVRFLEFARDIIRSHHEKWDGTGYPDRLEGEDIPLPARIVAVADVYDALTSKRVYKDAFSPKKARDILVSDAGSHFDPEVVEAFLACEDEFDQIRRRFNDAAGPSELELAELVQQAESISGD